MEIASFRASLTISGSTRVNSGRLKSAAAEQERCAILGSCRQEVEEQKHGFAIII